MADPTMPLNAAEISDREWIGAFDGMLLGFEDTRSVDDHTRLVAQRKLIQFFWEQRRVGLKALGNRITQVPLHEIDTETQKPYFKPKALLPMIRTFLQAHRSTLKKAHAKEVTRPTVEWPSVPTSWDDVLPTDHQTMENLHIFTSTCLQHTPSKEWTKPTSANASFVDKKWANHFITTFWMSIWDYPNWLSSPHIWDARVEFGRIIGEAVDQPDGFDFPDGITQMDPKNPFYEHRPNEGVGLETGVHGKFNRHLVESTTIALRNRHRAGIQQMVKHVKTFGTIVGPDNDHYMPPRLLKKLTSFLHVRELQHVGIHVSLIICN